MLKIISLSLAALIAISLSACDSGPESKKTAGTLLGGTASVWMGSPTSKGNGRGLETADGALAGAKAGQQFGRALDDVDRRASRRTTQRALENGRPYEPVSWSNPDSGHSGEIIPEPAYRNPAGNTCREFTQSIFVEGTRETHFGTACRQQDGIWLVEPA